MTDKTSTQLDAEASIAEAVAARAEAEADAAIEQARRMRVEAWRERDAERLMRVSLAIGGLRDEHGKGGENAPGIIRAIEVIEAALDGTTDAAEQDAADG